MSTLFRHLVDQQELRAFDAFVSEFKRIASDLGMSGVEPGEKTFEAWYYAQRRPQRAARRVLINMFGYPMDQLWGPAPAGTPPSTSPPPNTPVMETRVACGTDLNEMRKVGAMAARRAKDFVLGTERDRVGDEALGFLDDEVTRLVADYPRVPLSDIWADLANAQDDAFRLLEGGRLRASQLRDLNFEATVLSFLMAKGSHDMGDPQTAMIQARVALACAKEAEHEGLLALVNGLKSLISYWAGRPEDAVHFARQGSAHASPLSGTVGLWTLGLEARAAALLGDEASARTANQSAVEKREQVVPDDLDTLGGLLTYPEAKQLYYTVESEVLLGHGDAHLTGQAETAVNNFSDPDDPAWAFGDMAGARCNLALVHLYAGDLDGVATAIRPVLDLPPRLRNNGIVVSAQRVRQALTQPHMRNALVARELREEIASYELRRPALPR
ncbi:hypothetical protein [Streptomyces qinglanensis]|uniref:hypothetical protein n=1 Tax=Streptomyces qinglanensis TaxID=943816 RepID=UPI003D71FF84